MLQEKIAGLALAAAALGALAMPAAAQTVKIGFIDTYSGPFAQAGDELDKASSSTSRSMRRTCRRASRSSS